jgi:hypothetical protein
LRNTRNISNKIINFLYAIQSIGGVPISEHKITEVSMLVACVWEEEDWCGQLREDSTGAPMSIIFRASSRGAVIGQMVSGIRLSHFEFRDVYGPPNGPIPSGK